MAKKQEGSFKSQLTVGDLISVHEQYKNNASEWRLLLSVYEGIKQIVLNGYITKHEREPQKAYERRIDELYGFGYSKSVIDIFHFYLFKKEPQRDLKALKSDPLWGLFFEDADLYGNAFDTTIMDISLYAAIEGHMGILVDKPKTQGELTKKQQIDNKLYPYIARYFPNAILDWAMGKDAVIEAGIWSVNVDGSDTTQIFSIKSPPLASIGIHTINCSMLDVTDMDDGTFGGLSALTNGILFRYIDGVVKNLAVIVNNMGFWEIGFRTEYSAKAPAGQYGFKARRHVPEVNGVKIRLTSGGASEFQVHVRDDLTDLNLVACVINGHMLIDE